MSKRKGSLQEIISKAIYHEDISLYTVWYRDFDRVVSVPLKEFLEASNNMETIPPTRIIEIKKVHEVLYRKVGYRGPPLN
ncbi:MAG TPA: DUF504 domain-containing protein [Nitrososphaeraceae archaeon]